MLWKCLKTLSNRVPSLSLTLFRRLFGSLSNILHSCFSRNSICSFLSIHRPPDSGSSTQSNVSAGVAAISLPGGVPTVGLANVSGNIACSSVPAAIPSSAAALPGVIGLQSQLHQHSVPPAIPARRRRKVPFVASTVQRYGKDMQIKSSSGIESIQPLVRQYPKRQLPSSTGWEAHVHPEGTLYFYHPVKRVFTDTNVQVQAFLNELNDCADDLLALAGSSGVDLTSSIELTLQLGMDPDTKERVCSYYFADRAERTLFWLHELGTEDLFDGVRGVRDHSHIHVITSEKSLSPFGGEELSKILELINHLEETTSEACSPHSICVIARFMQYFARAKFFNFCGQSCARLEADQSIYLTNDEHILKYVMSWIMELLCFGAPHAQMKELQRVWVDKSTSSPRWKDFNDKLSREWISITIYSTVMLTVDLSFLSVPSVNAQTSHSVAIITAYLSTFCVVGSLVVSILLAGQNRKYGNVSANNAVVFLTRMTNSMFGDKALAILHSLPYALLMMVYFVVGFSFLAFKSTSVTLLVIVGCGLLVVILLTLWPIWAATDYRVFGWLRERLTSSE
ncbi:hypothetical protein BDR06DRAFT_1013553 [Suillus hirtellus]|nr:hypothetical protein BDR06DRAFT_1013553 [Suillus hirtellus]